MTRNISLINTLKINISKRGAKKSRLCAGLEGGRRVAERFERDEYRQSDPPLESFFIAPKHIFNNFPL
jgi:hypothetical protein